MGNLGKDINMSSLNKIFEVLGCNIEDVIEFISKDENKKV